MDDYFVVLKKDSTAHIAIIVSYCIFFSFTSEKFNQQINLFTNAFEV